MFIRICTFDDGDNLIYQGQSQEMRQLVEGRNILTAGKILQVSNNMLLSVEAEEGGLHFYLIDKKGRVVTDMAFPEKKSLEVEKIISILVVNYNGKCIAINTHGELLGEYLTVYIREEEEDIVAEKEKGKGFDVLASVHDRP